MEHQRHESRSGRGAYAVRHTAAAAAQGCGLFHHSRGQGALGVGRYAGSQSLQHGLRRQRFGQRGRNAAQLPERGELRQYARKVEHAGRAEHDRVLRYGRAPDRSAHARGAQNARISHPARRALLPLYGALCHPYADPARQTLHTEVSRCGHGQGAGALCLDGRRCGQEPRRPARLSERDGGREEYGRRLHDRQRRQQRKQAEGRRAAHAEQTAARRQGVVLRGRRPRAAHVPLAGPRRTEHAREYAR